MKDKDNPIYPFEAAVARIEATAAAADAFGFAFHLTGRCELLAGECGSGRYNPPIESLRRCGRKGSYRTRTSQPRGGEDHLQRAFHTVQFHGGYSGPVLRCRVTASVRRPASGVRLISLATAIYRSAMQAVVDAATEARDQGTFGFVETVLPSLDPAGSMK